MLVAADHNDSLKIRFCRAFLAVSLGLAMPRGLAAPLSLNPAVLVRNNIHLVFDALRVSWLIEI